MQEDGGLIEGRNAVIEAFRAGVTIDKVFIAFSGPRGGAAVSQQGGSGTPAGVAHAGGSAAGGADAALRHIASTARAAGAVVSETDKRKLDAMSVTHAHQGVIAVASQKEYVTISDILELARSDGRPALVVLCDGITDPHNLGAIIRTCEAVGAHGVIIPKHRSAGLTATVVKASSGAVYHTAIARVTNLTAAIKELKQAGLWVFGAAAGGDTPLWRADLKAPCALVIGSEGSGISRLARDNCDAGVSIPMYGRIGSLNASVSAAVLLYEAARQRQI